jgi:hypothetical protein
MNTKLSQLLGIIQYEIRLQWARRSLIIVGICFAIVTLLFLILTTSATDQEGLTETAVTFGLIFSISPASLLLMLLTLPPVVAEAIAKDQQLGMQELRDALPIPPGLYLAGKVLGVSVCVLVLMTTIALLLWIAALFVLGVADVATYFRVWFTSIMPAGLFVSVLSVLLASRQPTRKRATMVGGLIAIYSLLTLPMGVGDSYDWPQAMLPSAWFALALKAIFSYAAATAEIPPALFQFANIPNKFLWQTVTAVAVQLIVIWAAVWSWWQWRRA